MRFSSQSTKRSIRTLTHEQQPKLFAGTRSKFIIAELTPMFVEAGLDEKQAHELAIAVASHFGGVDSIEKGNVKTMLFFSPQEMDQIVKETLELPYADPLAAVLSATEKKLDGERTKLKAVVKKAIKALGSKVKDAADIAIFGRMIANDKTLSVEGAGLFNHPLSTHRAASELDFFSSVDERRGEEESGAGHIGTLEFSSACYYRYVGLNLSLLRGESHLQHLPPKDYFSVLRTFLHSAVMAVPTARKNSMQGFCPPAYVLGVHRTGQPLQLMGAFESPIRANGNGYVEPSITALKAHYDALKQTYDLGINIAAAVPDNSLNNMIGTLLNELGE
jgi:CRISPR system Cascade subunit CasC